MDAEKLLTEKQLEVIHRIIEEHSTDTVDYFHAADDINAALFGGVGKWAGTARTEPKTVDAEKLREALWAHCPFDTEVDEEDDLPEPHCHANRDGECDHFAYCPMKAQEAALAATLADEK